LKDKTRLIDAVSQRLNSRITKALTVPKTQQRHLDENRKSFLFHVY